MKPLYKEDTEIMNTDGRELDRRIEKALTPIFKEYALKGYSIRDIACIAMLTVSALTSEIILLRNFKRLNEKDEV